MKFKCPKCNGEMIESIGNYHYYESGLDNVFLKNIKVFECKCDHSIPSLFRISRLHESIAIALLEKTSLLNGKEIKFLRKNIRMPSKVFAKKLGVGITTLSKWENSKQLQSPMNDRYIRLTYMIYKGIKNEVAKNIIDKIEDITLKESHFENLITASINDNDYYTIWSRSMEASSKYACSSKNLVVYPISLAVHGATAKEERSLTLHVQTEIQKTKYFSSNEVTSSKSWKTVWNTKVSKR